MHEGIPAQTKVLLHRMETFETKANGKREREKSKADSRKSKKKAKKDKDSSKRGRARSRGGAGAGGCVLCEEHGGPSHTHKTEECRKYDKNGKRKTGKGKPSKSNFVQVTKELEELKKELKREHKSKRSKKSAKRRRSLIHSSSESSDSD